MAFPYGTREGKDPEAQASAAVGSRRFCALPLSVATGMYEYVSTRMPPISILPFERRSRGRREVYIETTWSLSSQV